MNLLSSKSALPFLISGLALSVLCACGGSSDKDVAIVPPVTDVPPAVTDPSEPDFSVDAFDQTSATVTNPYFPLTPGTQYIYEGLNDEGEVERIVINISHETREVDGVNNAIVLDRVYVDGELVEETYDWYAQDIEGNVWYMGEESAEFEDGAMLNTAGSWESGRDIDGIGSAAIAGIFMKAELLEGDSYQQEFYPGVAEDMAQVDSLDVEISLTDGSVYTTVKILEWNPLDEDSTPEYKYFASDFGLVVEEKEDGSERIELIEFSDQSMPNIDPADFSQSLQVDNAFFPLVVGSILTYESETEDGLEEIVVEVLPTTRNVMGIECVIVRDTVTLDGLVVEDTYDWYAQDDEGNVWYMGEDVDNYNYDDEDNLLSITHEGAWEAGVDNAQPGVQMPAEPRRGDSYRQEYLAGEAEDLAAIRALEVVVELSDGSEYTTLKTREWNPLEEDSTEYKYYAQGLGLVLETDEDEQERVELVSVQP